MCGCLAGWLPVNCGAHHVRCTHPQGEQCRQTERVSSYQHLPDTRGGRRQPELLVHHRRGGIHLRQRSPGGRILLVGGSQPVETSFLWCFVVMVMRLYSLWGGAQDNTLHILQPLCAQGAGKRRAPWHKLPRRRVLLPERARQGGGQPEICVAVGWHLAHVRRGHRGGSMVLVSGEAASAGLCTAVPHQQLAAMMVVCSAHSILPPARLRLPAGALAMAGSWAPGPKGAPQTMKTTPQTSLCKLWRLAPRSTLCPQVGRHASMPFQPLSVCAVSHY